MLIILQKNLEKVKLPELLTCFGCFQISRIPQATHTTKNVDFHND